MLREDGGSSDRAIEHFAVCRRLLTCPTPQCAPIPITTAASSELNSQSSSTHHLSSANAARHASASEIPDTTVINRVGVITLGAPIDLGRGTGRAEATIRVPT